MFHVKIKIMKVQYIKRRKGDAYSVGKTICNVRKFPAERQLLFYVDFSVNIVRTREKKVNCARPNMI